MPDGPWTATAMIVVAAITVFGGPWMASRLTTRRIEQRIGPKVDGIHQATTVNHHSSAEPTILDRLDDIAAEQLRAKKRAARIEKAIGLSSVTDEELDAT